jgi:hypothetical protein
VSGLRLKYLRPKTSQINAKKNTDLKLAKKLTVNLDYSRIIRSKKELKAYVNYLLSFLAKVISALVLLYKAFNYTNL